MTYKASYVHISDPAEAPLVRYHACKAMAKGYAEARKSDRTRLAQARAFCATTLESLWDALCERHEARLKIKAAPLTLPVISVEARQLAVATGRLIAEFPVEDAGYLVGSIYTVMLPSELRSELGAYYTPPPLVNRLLDLAETAGFNFSQGSAIDPACGGGAFLAPLAMRMAAANSGESSPEWVLASLGKRLKGLEIDPFAAWMTSTLLEASLLPLCVAAKRRMPNVVTVCDSLQPRSLGMYDLVIGNPPYGRVSLDAQMRAHYARSLYGHANLYGLFTDLALRLVKPNGVLAYLTPTSFLGGQYFKALRELLAREMTPVAFDLISDRNGVFDDVLQETLLTAYIKGNLDTSAKVSIVIPQGLHVAKTERLGETRVQANGRPWMLPRTAEDVGFLEGMSRMPTRLSDLGYSVSTGPLVWNRHKGQLRDEAGPDTLPLIWAESIVQGSFVFSAARRNHVPYIHPAPDQSHLVARNECLLVQRTTSKEQERRLVSAILPQEFIDRHGGAVIENHLNVISASGQGSISPGTICELLNTRTVDRAFRCISGSVAVSAYELNALPLPRLEELSELERLIQGGASKAVIEKRVSEYYGAS